MTEKYRNFDSDEEARYTQSRKNREDVRKPKKLKHKKMEPYKRTKNYSE